MLPHRPRHSRHDVVDIGSVGGSSVELDRVVSAGATYEGVYRSTRPGDRLRGVTERAQLSLVSLPIPLLNHNSRQMRTMSAGKRSFSLEGDTSSTSTLAGVDPPSVGPVGLGSPTSPASRKTTKLFAALRRSNSFSHKRSGKNSSGHGMFSTPAERSASVSPAGSRTTSPARTTQPPSIAQIAMGLHTSRTPHLGPAHGFLLTGEPGAQRTGSAVHLHSHSHSHYAYAQQHVRGRTSKSPPPSRPQTASSSTRVAVPLRSSLKKDVQKSNGKGLNAAVAAGADASRSTSPSASASSTPSTPRSTLSRISLAITKGTGLTGGRSRLDKFLGRGLGLGRGTNLKSPVSSVASLNSNSSDGELGAPRKAVRFVATVANPDPTTTTKTAMGGDNRLHPPRA